MSGGNTQTRTETTDRSIHAKGPVATGGAGGSINFFGSKKDLILGVMLGLVLVEGFMLFYEWRHKAQQNELARANFTDWQTFSYNPDITQLKAAQLADSKIIETFALSKVVTDKLEEIKPCRAAPRSSSTH